MDINDLYSLERHETGAEMQVRDENGEKLDAFITIAGVDSKLFRKAKNELRREILKDIDADYEELRAKKIAEVTIGWRGFNNGTKKLKFTKKLAEQLYLNAPYLMDQADEFINTRLNFTKS
jgi:hypothetical protein